MSRDSDNKGVADPGFLIQIDLVYLVRVPFSAKLAPSMSFLGFGNVQSHTSGLTLREGYFLIKS